MKLKSKSNEITDNINSFFDDENNNTTSSNNQNNNKSSEKDIIIPINTKTKNSNDVSLPLIGEIPTLNNKLKDDHLILIEYLKILKIPYFIFGFTIHFYFPFTKLPYKIKLSEIPTPTFTLGPGCKNKHFLFFYKL